MSVITRKNTLTAASTLLCAGLAYSLVNIFAGGVQDVFNKSAKDAACDPITDKLETAVSDSDLLDRLQNVADSGRVRIRIEYDGDSTTPVIGSDTCGGVYDAIYLSK